MATRPRAVAAVRAVHPLEDAMITALNTAVDGPERQVKVVANPNQSLEVRAVFLRAFLLERIPKSKLPIGHFTLDGATIFDENDRLDLRGIELEFLVRFTNCRFLGGIDLSDSKIIGLDLISGEASEINADRLTARGSLLIRAPMPREAGILAEPNGGPFVVSQRIRLCGAKIHGNVDLRGCWLTGWRDPERVPLFADGLAVEGNLLLSNRFTADGEVRLNGSQIDRNLDCSGATLRNARGYSLSAAGAHIKGSVYLTHVQDVDGNPEVGFSSVGAVRFEGAKIDGDFDLSAGRFTARPLDPGRVPQQPRVDDWNEDDWYAIRGDELEVGGDILFSERCHVSGSVKLINVRVGGDFIFQGAHFDFPGEETLVADGIDVSGTTFLQDETVTNGIFRFAQANLRQGFRARGVKFDLTGVYRHHFDNKTLVDELYGFDDNAGRQPRGLCGIYAPRAEVAGTFSWKDVRKEPDDGRGHYDLWLYLFGSTVDAVEDRDRSWKILDRFDITGCKYGSIAMLSNEIDWRLGELDRQYAILNRETRIKNVILACQIMLRRVARLDEAIVRFKPQPYIQLARVVRRGGHEEAANKVLVQLERNRTRYSDFGAARQLARHFLDGILKYGFSRFRPIWILLVWALVSALCFEAAYQRGRIVSIPKPSSSVNFNALVYAIDTLVPIVDLNQKKNWVVQPVNSSVKVTHSGPSWWQWIKSKLPWGPGFLVFFNTFFGWAMTTFFAAGISGLLRTGREDG